MPRWNKTPADYDAAITKSKEKIAKYKQLLEEEEETLAQLEAGKRDAELKAISEYMTAHDLSPSDVVRILSASIQPQQSITFNV